MAQRRAQERLLEAAAMHFYADGIAATGIDAITAEAGVAKMSLYNNFSSKADLVLAYISARHEQWLELYRTRVADAATPPARVLAVFDAYIDHAEAAYERGFRGCGLLNAAAEFPVGDPARQIVRTCKEQVEQILTDHLKESCDRDPVRAGELAEHLCYLLEGAVVRAGLDGEPARLHRARRIAENTLAYL